MAEKNLKLVEILKRRKEEILEEWIKKVISTIGEELLSREQARKYCDKILTTLLKAISKDNLENITQPEYVELTSQLRDLSSLWVEREYPPEKMGKYILSFKDSALKFLEEEHKDNKLLYKQALRLHNFTDMLLCYNIETYTKKQKKTIVKQMDEILEVSTPVTEVCEGILVVPLIGTLDSKRTQVVMEKLLDMIIKKHSLVVIIDIIGVLSLDTEVASHLLRTCNAVKLLGAQGIITGISPSIAQTMVQLGINMGDIFTRALLYDGMKLALRIIGKKVVETKNES